MRCVGLKPALPAGSLTSKWPTRQLFARGTSLSGTVFWIAGLSGAGKTTIGLALVSRIRRSGGSALLLDGDDMRRALEFRGYSERSRLAVGRRYVRLAGVLASQGLDVVIAAGGLSPGLHPWAREMLIGYRAILLQVSLREVQRRDTKSLYAKFARGEISDLAGVDTKIAGDDEFDVIVPWTAQTNVEDSAHAVFEIWQGFKGDFR